MEIVNYPNIIPVLATLGVIGAFGFWKLIEHFKYELNFRESLLFPILVLILAVVCLTDLRVLDIDESLKSISIGVAIYFLILLVSYYVIRAVKLQKYIPAKIILAYVVISVAYFICLAIPLFATDSPARNINGWDALGLCIYYVMFCIACLIALVFVNIVLCVVFSGEKDSSKPKNINYNFSEISYFNVLAGLVIIGSIFGINYYNGLNYNKMLERQREVVMDYLHEEYPGSEFEIVRMHETCVGGFMFSCGTEVIRNEIVNRTTGDIVHRCMQIDVEIAGLKIHDVSLDAPCDNK